MAHQWRSGDLNPITLASEEPLLLARLHSRWHVAGPVSPGSREKGATSSGSGVGLALLSLVSGQRPKRPVGTPPALCLCLLLKGMGNACLSVGINSKVSPSAGFKDCLPE